jgi:hypothetical protein
MAVFGTISNATRLLVGQELTHCRGSALAGALGFFRIGHLSYKLAQPSFQVEEHELVIVTTGYSFIVTD